MKSEHAGTAGRIARHPVLRILASFPIACFCCALATDIAYAQTAGMMWADFSAWLLAAGTFMGLLAAIAGLVVIVSNRRAPTRRPAWPLVLGSLLVLILGFFNNLVHSRDAWTSVVPTGLTLSAVTVVVMLVTAWLGSRTMTRRSVDMQYSEVPQ